MTNYPPDPKIDESDYHPYFELLTKVLPFELSSPKCTTRSSLSKPEPIRGTLEYMDSDDKIPPGEAV